MTDDAVTGDLAPEVRRVREMLAALPRVSLAHLPTPLDDCPRLSSSVGVALRIKREDCTGLAFGGNKVRQHEYILGDALAAGADCLIQGAASQSNHSRQLAAAGAKLGVEVHLLPRMDARSSPPQANFLLDHLLGATIHPIPADGSSIKAKQDLAAELRRHGKTPYVLGMGSPRAAALAAVACIEVACEIAEAPGPLPTAVVVTSQGSTQAGIQLGFEMLGVDVRVYGINPVPTDHEAYVTPATIAEIAQQAAGLVGWSTAIDEKTIENTTEFAEPGYGVPSDAGLAAIRLVGSTAGIVLDPVYSSKGFSGLVEYRRRGVLTGEDDVVFVHTGGLPIVFAYNEDIYRSLTFDTA